MRLATLADKVEVYEHVLDAWADQDIPVSTGLVAQGDVVFIPESIAAANGVKVADDGWAPVTERVLVDGTHRHVLIAEKGVCRFTAKVTDSQGLAVGVIDAAAPVFIVHAEHGAVGLAPGRWVVRQTREQADEIRKVLD